MYGLLSDKAIMSPETLIFPSDDYISPSDLIISAITQQVDDHSSSSLIKARISSHHLFPRLLQAYIDCHKVYISIYIQSFNFLLIYWFFLSYQFICAWVLLRCSSSGIYFIHLEQSLAPTSSVAFFAFRM